MYTQREATVNVTQWRKLTELLLAIRAAGSGGDFAYKAARLALFVL
jgi:ATP-dependent protease HslVU (ClpYQ) peptidase subunit